MIKTITVSGGTEKKTFDLLKPESTGFLVYKIDGLGPGDIDVHTSERPFDGDYFISTRKPKRPISIYIKPIWIAGKTIEQLRNELYRYFPMKKELTLVFETHSRTAMISGYVSNIAPDIFSAAETVQIDIVCPDPYFSKSPASKVDFSSYTELDHFKLIIPKTFGFVGNDVQTTFKIPDAAFEEVRPGSADYISYQKVYTPNGVSKVVVGERILGINQYRYSPVSRMVELIGVTPEAGEPIDITIEGAGNPVSIINNETFKTINYSGDIDTGVLIRIIFFNKTAYKKTFSIGKADDNEWINVSLIDTRLNALLEDALSRDFPHVVFSDSDYYIKPEDVIFINTNPGKKSIHLRRMILGKEYFLSLANCIYDTKDTPFVWWQLGPGDNGVTIQSDDNDILNYASVMIDYSEKFIGL